MGGKHGHNGLVLIVMRVCDHILVYQITGFIMTSADVKYATLKTRFEKLPKVERSIVQLLSILLEPVNRTSLNHYLRELDVRGDDGKRLLVKTLSPIIKKLEEQGLLIIDSEYAHQFQCPESIYWVVTCSAVEDGSFQAMVQVAQKHCPALTSYGSARYRGSTIANYTRCLREIRIAVFAHDPDNFTKYLQLAREQFPEKLILTPPLVRICAAPYDDTWFRALPLSIQVFALEEIVIHGIENFDDLSRFMPLLQTYRHQADESEGQQFRHLLVTVLMVRGELKEAAEILKTFENIMDHQALQGWWLFLHGDNAQAIEVYDAALRKFRRNSRDKKEYFPHLSGLFYLLALLKSPDQGHHARFVTLLTQIRKQVIRVAWPVYICLEALSMAQLNKVDHGLLLLDYGFIPESDLIALMDPEQFRKNVANTPRLGQLFTEVVRYWIDPDKARQRKHGLKALFSRAKREGYQWIAMELAELLSRLEASGEIYQEYATKVQQQTEMHSIVPIISPQESWERALHALRLLTSDSGAGNKSAKARSTNRRLVWLIDVGINKVNVIQPKEQAMTKNGGWTKGRVVGLKRLFGGTSDLDFITNQDRLISRAILQENQFYGGVRYSFDWESAMLAMVGHPLVFWEHAPTVNVEIVRAEPELLVQKVRGGVNIGFSTLLSEQKVIASQESPTRCQLIEVTEDHKTIGKILGNNGLKVPDHGKEQVLEIMHAISPLVTIQSAIGGGQEDITTVTADSKPYIQLLPMGEGLKLKVLVRPFAGDGPYFMPGKGGKTIITEVAGERKQTNRNLKSERTQALAVLADCPSLVVNDEILQEWHFEEPESCLELLLDLQAVEERVQLEWPEGQTYKVPYQVNMDQCQVRIQRDQDWFALSGELRLDESLILKMGQLLDLAQNAKGRFLPLGDGQFVALTEHFRKQLQEIAAFSEQSEMGQRFHPLAAPIFQEISENVSTIKTDKAWKTHVKKFQNSLDHEAELPSTLQVELRDYQLLGFQWLSRLAAWGVGACLADDMGLGKTVQALALMVNRAAQGPMLIVAPTSVCLNWLKEIRRFAPTLTGYFFTGNNRQQMIDDLKPFDVLVSSYGLLQQESEKLRLPVWNMVVLDEAQAIKNRNTKRSKAAMELQGSFKVLLTGTPIENHLGELWNLFQFINPGLLGSMERFNERFAAPIERHRDKIAGKQLKKLIQPFILRRTKSQVLEELPARTEITLQVEMSEEEQAFYETLRRRALEQIDDLEGPVEQNQFQIFAEIMRLRRACCNSRLIMADSHIPSTKLELFWSTVEGLLENKHKVLVFSQFVDHLAIIRERLEREKVRYQYLDGSTPAKERQRRVDAFQAGEGDLFLISLRAGGMGINLTAADYVIHMDPWWNPAVEDQASDRAHRIGQMRPVTIYRLVTKGSIEEMIVDLHQHKRHLADGLLDGSDMSGKLSAAELLQMIRG